MAHIQAFRGLRYDLSKVGSLTSVVAPPYDVINSQLQQQLYDRNPHNVVRLILNRGDDLVGDESIYDRAGQLLKSWRREGVLKPENEGVVYVYHQKFDYQGRTYVRRGFMARVRLEPFGSGKIYPHEETHAKAKEDRFKLTMACRANLSQIFGIFPDPENEVQQILESAIDDQTPSVAMDDYGVEHSVWTVKDPDAITAVANLMGPKPIYIADGHHRYETACNIQSAIRQSENINTAIGEHPVDYVLMMCISMQDPGMAILPTHRLFRGVPAITSTELIAKLEPTFDCEIVGTTPATADEVWEMILLADEQSCLGFYCRADDSWVLAWLNQDGETHMNEIAGDQSDEWRSLGVSILHRLVMGHLLGFGDSLPSPKYVHAVEEVIEGIKTGDMTGRDATGQEGSGSSFELAALVMPASVDHVQSISESGERMPAKSTYFYPKLLSGLVVNPLE